MLVENRSYENSKEGRLCGCGQRGCFEAYASATGLIREAVSRLTVNKQNLLYTMIEGI